VCDLIGITQHHSTALSLQHGAPEAGAPVGGTGEQCTGEQGGAAGEHMVLAAGTEAADEMAARRTAEATLAAIRRNAALPDGESMAEVPIRVASLGAKGATEGATAMLLGGVLRSSGLAPAAIPSTAGGRAAAAVAQAAGVSQQQLLQSMKEVRQQEQLAAMLAGPDRASAGWRSYLTGERQPVKTSEA
jgi:hypothetical protein